MAFIGRQSGVVKDDTNESSECTSCRAPKIEGRCSVTRLFISVPSLEIGTNPSLWEDYGGSPDVAQHILSRRVLEAIYSSRPLACNIYVDIPTYCQPISSIFHLNHIKWTLSDGLDHQHHVRLRYQNATPCVTITTTKCFILACAKQITVDSDRARAVLAEDQAMEKRSRRRIQILPVAGTFSHISHSLPND